VNKPARTLSKRLADELSRTARPGKADEARRYGEKLIEALERGRPLDVKRAAIRAKQAAPRSAWVREELGKVCFELEDWHEATQELLAYRRFTADRRQDATIAECYRRQEKPARSLELLADLKQPDVPANVWIQAQVVRARALADTGRKGAALTLLKAAVRATEKPSRRPLLEVIADLTA
jgi:tetratricopeptide (TPR) repeat protein